MKGMQEAKTMGVAAGWAACVALASAVAQTSAGTVADTTARAAVPSGGCARTPAAAVLAAVSPVAGSGAGVVPVTQGYRVRAVRWDPLQQQNWAVVERCEHPELPAVAVLTKLPGPFTVSPVEVASQRLDLVAGETASASVIRANSAVSVVKTGDMVRLWKADERAHIELVGTAEENGVVGARVRVRLATPKEADGQMAPPQFLAGVVRGPADVEIER